MTEQYPFTDYTLNLATSVSKDEAVAKILGLMRGAIRNFGSTSIEADLIHSLDLTYDLKDYLQNMREKSVDKLIKVFGESSDEDEKADAYYEVLRCDKLINKAQEYLAAINYELSHAENSSLKLDAVQTQATGESYIYLASLDEWVKQKYKFSIYPDTNLNVINPEIGTIQFDDSHPVETAVMDDIEHDYTVRAKTVAAIKKWAKSNKRVSYSDTETNNFLITFFSTLLDKAQYFGDVKPKNLRELTNTINTTGTATVLAERVYKEFGDVTGQSFESIKSRIEVATTAAKNNLGR